MTQIKLRVVPKYFESAEMTSKFIAFRLTTAQSIYKLLTKLFPVQNKIVDFQVLHTAQRIICNFLQAILHCMHTMRMNSYGQHKHKNLINEIIQNFALVHTVLDKIPFLYSGYFKMISLQNLLMKSKEGTHYLHALHFVNISFQFHSISSDTFVDQIRGFIKISTLRK